MKWLILALILSAEMASGQSQARSTLAQAVYAFHSEGGSRLVALARLGATMNTSILVESGSRLFLKEPISVHADAEPLQSVIGRIVKGPEKYKVKLRGSLLVIYPTLPKAPINRILSLELGPITYTGTTILDLDQTLSNAVEAASGCKDPFGFVWAGIAFRLSVPSFHLTSSKLEDIAEKVAESAERWMWVVAPGQTRQGCINDPLAMWQIGLYDNQVGRVFGLNPSAGPNFVH